jgi:hypothetical protein
VIFEIFCLRSDSNCLSYGEQRGQINLLICQK